MAITGVDAKDISNGEIMTGSLDYPDLIPGPNVPLDCLDRFPAGGRADGPGVSGGKPLASRASLFGFHCLAEAAR
jgi:hypothetical protein